MRSIQSVIGEGRFSLTDEKQTQIQIAQALLAAGIAHQREVRLSQTDIVDFLLLDDGCAMEVKIKGGRMAIYRQLERYAAHDRVKCILLLTSVSMHLPETIGGKPAEVISLSKGWL